MNKSDVYELPFYNVKKENLKNEKDNLIERNNGEKTDTNILQHRHKFFYSQKFCILFFKFIMIFKKFFHRLKINENCNNFMDTCIVHLHLYGF